MHTCKIIVIIIILPILRLSDITSAKSGHTLTKTFEQTAQAVYDQGFAKQVMRGADGSVKLWNRTLIENDAPGAGTSNKGAFLESVHGDRIIKKVLNIAEPRCEQATVVVFGTVSSDHPLRVSVNGHEAKEQVKTADGFLLMSVSPTLLRKGENEIVLSCPDAKDSEFGCTVYIARADEYKAGGWNPQNTGWPTPDVGWELGALFEGVLDFEKMKTYPANIGDYSLLSTNGGKKWSVRGKGLHLQKSSSYTTLPHMEKAGVTGEYCIRLNLQQYVREGVLISPVLDLWSNPDNSEALIPFTEVEKLTFEFSGNTAKGTGLVWQMRAGLSMDPCSDQDWSEWLTLSKEDSAIVETFGRMKMPPSHWDPERFVSLPKVRYIQWRTLLSTRDPLVSPVVKSVSIKCETKRKMEIPKNIMVTDFHNPKIMYSSSGFRYQSAEDSMNQLVIERDDLDRIVQGSGGEFDAMVRLLDYASRRWVYAGPQLEFPKWNTVDIAERAHSLGDGGMCTQFAIYLAHILTVMGHQARHVNILAHEVTEVWCNEFDKWIYLDPTQGVNLYKYDKRTGVPLSLFDIHRIYYKYYDIKGPIDWTADPEPRRKRLVDAVDFPYDFSTTDHRVELAHKDWQGYYHHPEFLRMMPRNDFTTTTIPEPLMQGSVPWPWNGYLNWYDTLAPPKLQYSWYTDRICDFWPTLNRVRFEAVPEINGDMVYITMITFTPDFKNFQIKTDNSEWIDSDKYYTWHLHSGKNRLEMRAVSKFGVCGAPSHIECNFVVKHIPKPVKMSDMNQ